MLSCSAVLRSGLVDARIGGSRTGGLVGARTVGMGGRITPLMRLEMLVVVAAGVEEVAVCEAKAGVSAWDRGCAVSLLELS